MEKYRVTLTADERYELEQLVRKGKTAARKLAHARILLLADEGDDRTGRADEHIAQTLQVSLCTVSRVRKRFVTEGIEQAVNPRRQPRRPDKIKLHEEAERQLVELACSDPPEEARRLLDRLEFHSTPKHGSWLDMAETGSRGS